MAAVLKHWREAATLMIIAPPARLQPTSLSLNKNQNQANSLQRMKVKHSDCNNNKSNAYDIQDYETLLLKRSSSSKFMPNLYVFPGGTSENNDFSPEWVSIFEKLGTDFRQAAFEKVSRGSDNAAPLFTRSRDPEFSKIPPEVAFRISAIRETFEESGILIVKKLEDLKEHKSSLLSEQWNASSSLSYIDDNCELEEWRKRVNENPDNFLKMCKEMDLIPDILSLYEWTDWLTPTALGGRRFDTIFYICYLEEKPDTKEDNTETIHHQWVSPFSVLSSYYKGNVGLAPPQVYELSRLMQFDNAGDLMHFAADRESERVERYFPVIGAAQDAMVHLLPGDDLYPETPDLYTPRHIIHFDQTMEELNKDVKIFHRTFIKDVKPGACVSVQSNLVFKNKHIGPVMNPQRVLGKL